MDKVKKEIKFKKQENRNVFFVSAKTGKGIKELLNKIQEHILFKTERLRTTNTFLRMKGKKLILEMRWLI